MALCREVLVLKGVRLSELPVECDGERPSSGRAL